MRIKKKSVMSRTKSQAECKDDLKLPKIESSMKEVKAELKILEIELPPIR